MRQKYPFACFWIMGSLESHIPSAIQPIPLCRARSIGRDNNGRASPRNRNQRRLGRNLYYCPSQDNCGASNLQTGTTKSNGAACKIQSGGWIIGPQTNSKFIPNTYGLVYNYRSWFSLSSGIQPKIIHPGFKFIGKRK